MGDVKRSIVQLCRILKLSGLSSLTAEDVRKAKFNKLDDPVRLWHTLHSISSLVREHSISNLGPELTGEPEECHCRCSYEVKNMGPSQCCGGLVYCKSALYHKDPVCAAQQHVLYNLRLLGFCRTLFWPSLVHCTCDFDDWSNQRDPAETADSSSKPPSRPLIIALFWLLGKGNVMTALVNKLETAVNTELSQSVIRSPSAYLSGSISSATLPPQMAVTQLVAIAGRLRSTWHQLESLSCDHARLSHRIMSCLSPVFGASPAPSQNAHTVRDVKLLYRGEQLESVCRLLSSINTLLALISAWHGMEEIFWTWAKSIIDEEAKYPCIPTPSTSSLAGSSQQCPYRLSEALALTRPDVGQSFVRMQPTLCAPHAKQCDVSSLASYTDRLTEIRKAVEADSSRHSAQCHSQIRLVIESNEHLVFLP